MTEDRQVLKASMLPYGRSWAVMRAMNEAEKRQALARLVAEISEGKMHVLPPKPVPDMRAEGEA